MAKSTILSKDFLETKDGAYWVKDQVIFQYRAHVDKQLIIDQVVFYSKGALTAENLKITALNKTGTSFLLTGRNIHKLADGTYGSVHAPRNPQPPHAPIIPGIIHNGLLTTITTTSTSFHTIASDIRKEK